MQPFNTSYASYRVAGSRCRRTRRSKMILPTFDLVSEYKVHEDMLNQILGEWSSKDLVSSPQDISIEDIFADVLGVTVALNNQEQGYLDQGILPFTLVQDRVLDPLFTRLGFLQAGPDEKADVAFVLEAMIFKFYLFLSQFFDMIGFSIYQCETISFSHWQGRSLVVEFEDL